MPRFRSRTLSLLGLAALATLALGACSDPKGKNASPQAASAPSPDAPTTLTPPPEVGPPVEPHTVGGDGSEIRLSPLSEGDLKAQALAGELACAFSAEQGSLLLAKGNVGSRDPAQGLVKVGDYVERIGAPGGFDGMAGGATFSGQGKTIRIALTGPAIGGGESPPRPATLTYLRADGASLTLPGRWSCGP
ncbi:hypothetical protein [Caulobacter endophyticus]|uniref:hypothetical protein n=1 Tax=Caulobacter endophyticus TaxID=2172652 RepID=UPI0024104543|nr:hypothetical protein [Caulobacter endophyticus]MDG2530997.1 hypothetical protein [Caulobacter endophyticus]